MSNFWFMAEKRTLDFVGHSLLPEDVMVAVCPPDIERSSDHDPVKIKKDETRLGRSLVAGIVAEKLGTGDFEIISEKDTKPTAKLNGKPVHISISHCREMICGAVSAERVLGLDVESVFRSCYPKLRDRIVHTGEADAVESVSTLQLWTIKEAALKWSGSGLRTAMNKIRIVKIRKPLFFAELPDGKCLEICSFQYSGHWLSVAYTQD
jgi:phosphopantetheinyl transferase